MLGDEAIGQTFATGSGAHGIELKIDSTTYYNSVLQPQLSWSLKNLKPWKDDFFNYKDVKPGDTGTNIISIHIDKNAAFVCLDFQNLRDRENGRNEPEREEDNNGKGELSEELEFFAWHDDGDGLFEVGEEAIFGTSSQSAKDVLKGKSYALADSVHGSALFPNQTSYVGIDWCAGDLRVNLATAEISCDAEAMGNEAQTDSMTLDVSLRAVVAKQQPWFTCVKDNKPPYGNHGNNGHGNEGDHNDDSNPGHSNDPDDDTDDDGLPGHHSDDNHHDDDDESEWHYGVRKSGWQSVKNYCVAAWNNSRFNRQS